MKNILLIGNSPIVLNYELGEKINSFDVIVRFNDFKILGYEKHIGTKTTIWANSAAPPIINRDISDFSKVWIPEFSHIHPTEFNKRITRVVPDNSKLQLIPKEICSNLHKDMQLSLGWASTGMYAIYFALTQRYAVHVHGFNSFQDCGKTVVHYFNMNEKETVGHNKSLEKKYFDHLLSSNKIKKII